MTRNGAGVRADEAGEWRRVERYVDVPGGRLFAVDEGDGPPIVLLHAAIVDHRAWDGVVPPLLAAGFRTVRYDARGFGRSETADVEFEPHADLAAVMDALGIERAVLAGNSLGGSAAMDAALVYPERIAGVVMVASDPSGFVGELTELEQAYDDEGTRLESAVPRDADAIVDFDVRLWVDGPGRPPNRPGTERAADLVREIDAQQYAAGHLSGQRVRLAPPAIERLHEIRCPVLAITGELDLSLLRAAAERIVAECPQARALEVGGVAHLVGMERPEELARLVAEFAAEIGAL